jgi:hypothetical protein
MRPERPMPQRGYDRGWQRADAGNRYNPGFRGARGYDQPYRGYDRAFRGRGGYDGDFGRGNPVRRDLMDPYSGYFRIRTGVSNLGSSRPGFFTGYGGNQQVRPGMGW